MSNYETKVDMRDFTSHNKR